MNTCIKTRKQLALEYGISERTLRRYIKKLNIEIPSGNLTPKNQKIIYENLGYPNNILEKDD
ncbi:MAG: hypothetical protein ACPGXZ_10220 [Saprospiraceae bacterium]